MRWPDFFAVFCLISYNRIVERRRRRQEILDGLQCLWVSGSLIIYEKTSGEREGDQSHRDNSSSCCPDSELDRSESPGSTGLRLSCSPPTSRQSPTGSANSLRDVSDVSMSSSLSSVERGFMLVWPLIPSPAGLQRFKSSQNSTTNYGYF